jgi:hypothetical protein
MSEIGPYAGSKSHNERWITVRIFPDGIVEAEGNGSEPDVPYMSEMDSLVIEDYAMHVDCRTIIVVQAYRVPRVNTCSRARSGHVVCISACSVLAWLTEGKEYRERRL